MRTIHVPIFPQNEEDGEFLVFLPGVSSTSPEDVSFRVDHDNDLLVVTSYSQTFDGDRQKDRKFGIEINDSNQDLVDEIESLTVINPEELSPEQFTDNPTIQDELRELFDYLDEYPAEETTADPKDNI